jgi:N-acetylglutamate synthase-like GNAT family acetyltransferase
MPNVNIIPLQDSHSTAIVDLILSIQQIEFGLSLTINDQPDLLNIENFYKLTGGEFWGAFYEGKLIGTIGLIKIANKVGVIRKMFVAKAFRGGELGVAQLLLNTLISYCKENNITSLYLGTQEVLQAAARFYIKNNFDRIDKGQLPVGFPLMPVDNAFYTLQIVKNQKV